MLRAIAIDDEPAALEVLNRYAEKVPFLELTASFLSTTEALTYLHSQKAELIFLDIRMPDLTGTEFAQLIAPLQKRIIFTTAYEEYALEGFTLNALDYLLKPIAYTRFLQSCNRAYSQMVVQRGEPSSIFVKDSYDWVRVNLPEILYIHSDTNLLFIHQSSGPVSTRMTLADMLDLLPAEQFIRVHKSYVVSVNHIQKIERHQLLVGNVCIPLASTYRPMVEQLLLPRKEY